MKKTKKKNGNKALAKKVARFGAKVIAVSRHYEEHARDISAFAKKIKGEWNSTEHKKK